ncbi:hypothetical protein FOB31_22675 [Burkholderia multivorans]|nr:hypothetical protein FOB31_22675 [Burkholderia multivorans]QET37636.1 hypothetical protein FOB30_07900 [Burkholderia multivorans]
MAGPDRTPVRRSHAPHRSSCLPFLHEQAAFLHGLYVGCRKLATSSTADLLHRSTAAICPFPADRIAVAVFAVWCSCTTHAQPRRSVPGEASRHARRRSP